MEKILSKKFKLTWIALTSIFYIGAGIASKGNVLLMLAGILTVVAILLYAEHAILSVGLFMLTELCNWGTWMTTANSPGALALMNPELYILLIGTVVGIVIMIIKIKKNKMNLGSNFKEKAISIITFVQRPRKLRAIFRVIIYCMFITSCMSLASGLNALGKGYDITMLSSIWAIVPTFATLATVLLISDMYIMRFISQGVLLILLYMQVSLGKADVISAVSNLIVTVTLIVGYIEYRKYCKQQIVKTKEIK